MHQTPRKAQEAVGVDDRVSNIIGTAFVFSFRLSRKRDHRS